MNFKKLISLLMVVTMFFAFAACSRPLPPTDNPSTQATTTIGATSAATTQTTTAATTTPPPEDKGIKNIILIIGDGMGPEHIAAGQLATGVQYDFTNWRHTNVNTDSIGANGIGGITTDSAAAATALATGTLTVNSYLGMDHQKKNLETILDHAKAAGKATGIVTTDNLYGATPSGFSAHSANRNDSATITTTQAKSNVDFLCGLRDDSHYLGRKTMIEENGYFFSTQSSGLRYQLKNVEKAYLTLDIENSQGGSIELCTAASLAINFLEKDEDGFVLIIEQAHIDKHAHSNSISGVVNSVNSLAKTVDTVMEWIGDRDDTAVLVTADHETGGLAVSAQPIFLKSYTHHGGLAPIYYSFSSTNHTDQHVKLFVHGFEPDFASYKYYSSDHQIKNTDVFLIMKDILDGELK